MPLAIVGNCFAEVWGERNIVKVRALLLQLLAENDFDDAGAVAAAARAFTIVDTQV